MVCIHFVSDVGRGWGGGGGGSGPKCGEFDQHSCKLFNTPHQLIHVKYFMLFFFNQNCHFGKKIGEQNWYMYIELRKKNAFMACTPHIEEAVCKTNFQLVK